MDLLCKKMCVSQFLCSKKARSVSFLGKTGKREKENEKSVTLAKYHVVFLQIVTVGNAIESTRFLRVLSRFDET